jgi:predicted Zn finger-like uncharacterized protein
VIIDCICGKKKFRVPDEQMPREGRKVQCAACSQIWFYQPPVREELEEQEIEAIPQVTNEVKKEEQVKKVATNKPEAFKLSKDKIVQPKIKKSSSIFGPRKVIYIGFLLFFSLSIFLASIRGPVIKVYPFLKVYLSVIKILVMKLFKILGLF